MTRLRSIAVLAAAAIMALTGWLASSADTAAEWTDDGEATTGTFKTATLSQPPLYCSELFISSYVRLSWNSVDSATTYRLLITRNGTTTTKTIAASRTYDDLYYPSSFTVRLQVVSGNWESPLSSPQQVSYSFFSNHC